MSGPAVSSPQSSDGAHNLTDAALCNEVRNGEAWPLGELWVRH
ncbi:hypothetical protein [Leucobacter salsicius]|nr:hypothetical protein [Leucobacter salsicius]